MNVVQEILPSDVNYLVSDSCKENLSLFHLNVRSAVNKTDDLFLLFEEFNFRFSVIMLTETWYNHDSDMFFLPDYDHFTLSRAGKRGGGVSIQVIKQLNSALLDDFQ